MKVRKLIIPDLTRSAPRYICPECRYFSNITRTSRWRPVMLGQQKLGSKTWHRGAKRTTTLKVKTVPQGSLPAKPVENVDESDGPVYPTVLQQVRNNMQKFSHCVVLTRVGNFYEMYFEHAEIYGPLMNLKVAVRAVKNAPGPVYMAGFPFFQLDRFLKILVQDLGKYVAISEEFANDPAEKVKSGGLLFDRKVARIITPGTLIDEKFMDPWENNYLLSIHADLRHWDLEVKDSPSNENISPPKTSTQEVGLAWLDLSSGDFFTQRTNVVSLPSVIARIGPREVIIDQEFRDLESSRIISTLRDGQHVITYHEAANKTGRVPDWGPMLEDTDAALDTTKFTEVEIAAGNFLLQYVNTQLQGSKAQLQTPVQRHDEEYMMIDKNSLRALEVKSTLRDGNFEGSLLHAVRRTATKSGARLLSQRLSSPSMSLEEVNQRLDLVSEMLENPILRQDLVALLRRTFDSLRLVQKFSFGRGDADDLLGLSRTIQLTSHIAALLKGHINPAVEAPENTATNAARGTRSTRGQDCIRNLLNRLQLDGPVAIAEKIAEAIDEDKLDEQHRIEDNEAAEMVQLAEEVLGEAGEEVKLKGVPKGVKKAAANGTGRDSATDDVWIMRRSASKSLGTLHDRLDGLFEEKEQLEQRLKEKSGAKSLTLKWTPGLSYICHIKGKDIQASLTALGSTRGVSSSRSTRSFHLTEWTQLGGRIDEAKLRIRAEEQRVFAQLREMVVRNLVKLRKNAAVLDEVDVACSFATLASEQRLVRPILNYGTTNRIVGGRHPVVEVGLMEQGRKFTSNDCVVGDDERILLITGPNMAGKSTFLRQNALISILAQTGAFVPAEYAEIGLVDKIFSRVGSADNLYNDQSTFMVEMLETAEILRQATPRSFVIMDEVGRGTTPEDGTAVGFACLYHLYHVNKCRALFATHFHALADMTAGFEKLACYCTDVMEEGDGSFSYVHRLRKGVNRMSHALKVARLAGLPEEAIAVAGKVLEQLKSLPAQPSQGTKKIAASG